METPKALGLMAAPERVEVREEWGKEVVCAVDEAMQVALTVGWVEAATLVGMVVAAGRVEGAMAVGEKAEEMEAAVMMAAMRAMGAMVGTAVEATEEAATAAGTCSRVHCLRPSHTLPQ